MSFNSFLIKTVDEKIKAVGVKKFIIGSMVLSSIHSLGAEPFSHHIDAADSFLEDSKQSFECEHQTYNIWGALRESIKISVSFKDRSLTVLRSDKNGRITKKKTYEMLHTELRNENDVTYIMVNAINIDSNLSTNCKLAPSSCSFKNFARLDFRTKELVKYSIYEDSLSATFKCN
jgi:hypothetical protein